MKNNICYLSREELTKDSMSLEHIIPNSIGGKIKSNHLINEYWNNKLGGEIENELLKQTPLPTLLGIKRDRGTNQILNAHTENGIKYSVHNSRIGVQKQKKPKITELTNGHIKYSFIQGQEKGILKKIRKENPEIDIKQLNEQIKWTSKNEMKTIFFDNGFSLISGSKAMRVICKIATNYYVHIKNEIEQIQDVIPFIKGEDEGRGILKYYYFPEEKLNYDTSEISHIIHIEGNKNERLLLAYIELFNCYNFLIVLNRDYKNDSFSKTYCYDLELRDNIEKKLSLNLTRENINDFNFPQDNDTEKNFIKRAERILKIKGINFTTKNKSQ